jgi:hypothetical protein
MAEAVCIRAEDAADVEAASPRALTHDGPVLVDAMVNRTELAMPPSITMEMARAFTLHMVKAVLNGGADGHRLGEDESVTMNTPFLQAAFQIVLGGAIVLGVGILIGGS